MAFSVKQQQGANGTTTAPVTYPNYVSGGLAGQKTLVVDAGLSIAIGDSITNGPSGTGVPTGATVTAYNSGTGAMTISLNLTVQASGAYQTGASATGAVTYSVALGSTPVSGNFVVVAMGTSSGTTGAATINSVTLGATGTTNGVPLYLMDNQSNPSVLLYGGYVSSTPAGLYLNINWTNSSGFRLGLAAAAMELTGVGASATPANATFNHSYNPGGLIDSSTPAVVAQPNSIFTNTYSGNGSILTISLGGYTGTSVNTAQVGSYITITGSSVTALNNVPMYVVSSSGYTTSGTITCVSSYNGTATEANNAVNIYESYVGGSSSVAPFSGPDASTYFGAVAWGGSAALPFNYQSGAPWIAAWSQTQLSVGTHVRMGSAGCTIPTSGSFTIPVSSTTGASSSGKLILYTQNGNIVVSYTSVTANTSFNGCTVATYPSTTKSVAGYTYLQYPTGTANSQSLSAPLIGSSMTSSAFGGLVTGDSSPSSTSVVPQATATASGGGYFPMQIILQAGYSNTGNGNVTTYIPVNVNYTAGTTTANGVIYSLSPPSPLLTRAAADAIAFADVPGQYRIKTRTPSDSLALNETVTARRTLNVNPTDSLSFSDSTSQTLKLNVSTSDSFTIGQGASGNRIQLGFAYDSISFNDVPVAPMMTFVTPQVKVVPPYLPETTGLAYRLFRHYEIRYRNVNVFLLSDGTFVQDYPTPENANANVPYPWNPNDPTALIAYTHNWDGTITETHLDPHIVRVFWGGETSLITQATANQLRNAVPLYANYIGVSQ